MIQMAVILLVTSSHAQIDTAKSMRREVDIKILSWTKTIFDKPIRIGTPEKLIEYREAVVLKIQVSRDQFDALPPDIAPFLYIGPEEYGIFHIERYDDRKDLTLIFHIRNWAGLRQRWPIVLTIDHGAPVRDRNKFDKPGIPRFYPGDIR